MKIHFSLLSGLIISVMLASCGGNSAQKTSFAIVVDSLTYSKTADAVNAYAGQLEKEGKKIHLIAGNFTAPETIRDTLEALYNSSPKLEGAVLIGEIPVVMVREGQHMTSAYKKIEDGDFFDSSVPTDRFYDDFDLKFDFIRPDTTRKNVFYYSLSPESAQNVHSEIYTARIKPSVPAGGDGSAAITAFLEKAVRLHQEKNPLDAMFIYHGHGSWTDAIDAWSGELVSVQHQIPSVFMPGGYFRMLHHWNEPTMKASIIDQLQRDDLDFAFFHEHGMPEVMYLTGIPKTDDTKDAIAQLKSELRHSVKSKVRYFQKDSLTAKREIVQEYGVPLSWMDGTYSKKQAEADSLTERGRNIYVADIYEFSPNARFIMLDACYNGSFNNDEYIAGALALGSGNTIAVYGNSVNSLQDAWPNELIGLPALGVSLGQWFVASNHWLEAHLIGDPTYRFAHAENGLNEAITLKRNDRSFWDAQLRSQDAEAVALALKMLFYMDPQATSPVLLEYYQKSPYPSVRMVCMELSRKLNDDNFRQLVSLAVKDPYEHIVRRAVQHISKSGDESLIEPIVWSAVNDYDAERVRFADSFSIQFMDPEATLRIADSLIDAQTNIRNKDKVKARIRGYVENGLKSAGTASETLNDPQAKESSKIMYIRMMRNSTFHRLLPDLIRTAENSDNSPKLRTTALEAMIWFRYSKDRQAIIDACDRMIASETDKEVAAQALRTRNTVTDNDGRFF